MPWAPDILEVRVIILLRCNYGNREDDKSQGTNFSMISNDFICIDYQRLWVFIVKLKSNPNAEN